MRRHSIEFLGVRLVPMKIHFIANREVVFGAYTLINKGLGTVGVLSGHRCQQLFRWGVNNGIDRSNLAEDLKRLKVVPADVADAYITSWKNRIDLRDQKDAADELVRHASIAKIDLTREQKRKVKKIERAYRKAKAVAP